MPWALPGILYCSANVDSNKGPNCRSDTKAIDVTNRGTNSKSIRGTIGLANREPNVCADRITFDCTDTDANDYADCRTDCRAIGCTNSKSICRSNIEPDSKPDCGTNKVVLRRSRWPWV